MSGTNQRRPPVLAVGWTRTDWINEVAHAIIVASIYWCESKLAGRNGKRWVARRRMAQFERELFMGFMHVAVYPVRREFDRRAAWREAIAEARRSVRTLKRQVENKLLIAMRTRRTSKRMQPQDEATMWTYVRSEATSMKLRRRPRVTKGGSSS
jgi:hypothetical protein